MTMLPEDTGPHTTRINGPRSGGRKSLDEYFMAIAREVASRSTCSKRRVGAVLVSPGKHILGTGYNGSAPGLPHCDDAGCMLENGKCVRTIHAELNSLLHASAPHLAGHTLYTTVLPCWSCFKAILACGISHVVYESEGTPDPQVAEAAAQTGIILRKLAPKS